jgi:hypothetical protein
MPPSSPVDQHWTSGRSGAPVGTREWADYVRLKLVSQVEHLGEDDESFIGWIELLEEHRAWPLLTKRDGSTFRAIEEFCAYQRPWGLGTSWSKLRPYLAAGLAKRGWATDRIERFLAMQAVPEPSQGERVDLATSPHDAEKLDKPRLDRLRAINRAPESVREAYQEGRISQTLAAKLGPKNPDPDTAAKLAEIAQAIRKEPDRKRVDAVVREKLGVEAPVMVRVERNPDRAASRLIERFGREWCGDLVVALDAIVNGARGAAE